MLKNYFILIFKSMRYRPVRSWLTILGIIIGIMLVVIIFALSSGIKQAIAGTLQTFGSDLVMILPGKESNPLLGLIGGQRFREKDLLDLQKIEGIKFVAPMEAGIFTVEYRGEKESTMLHASNWENYVKVLASSQGFKLEDGRWPEGDEAREVVLGYRAANTLFGKKIRVSDLIIIKAKEFKVVGILSEVGEQMADNVIFISMDLFHTMTGVKSSASSAFLKIKSDADMGLVSQQIKFELSKQEVVRDFSVITPDKANRLVGSVLSIIEIALIAIAFISLIVGAVGIMNTMYTSVLERKKQIGVMKAIGAKNDSILFLFLIESGIIGLVGGILGIFFGILAAYGIGIVVGNLGIQGIFSFNSLNPWDFLAVLVITFITGIVAGVLPTKQAMRLEPAEALRYE